MDGSVQQVQVQTQLDRLQIDLIAQFGAPLLYIARGPDRSPGGLSSICPAPIHASPTEADCDCSVPIPIYLGGGGPRARRLAVKTGGGRLGSRLAGPRVIPVCFITATIMDDV